MKIQSGYIPTDIVYVLGSTTEVTSRWKLADQTTEELKYIKVIPASIYVPDDRVKINRAIQQVKRETYTPDEVKAVMVSNKPLTRVQVVTSELSKEGMVYKVTTSEGYFFEISGDVLLEAMKNMGVEHGGYLKGEYVWAKIRNEMHLIRKDSELFNVLVEQGDRALLSPLPLKTLKPGGVYLSPDGKQGVFLGYVSNEQLALKWPIKNPELYYIFNIEDRAMPMPCLSVRKNNSVMLWFIAPYNKLTLDPTNALSNYFKNDLSKAHISSSFKLKTSNPFVKQIDQIDIPENIIDLVQAKALWTYKTTLAHCIDTQTHNNNRKFFLEVIKIAINAAPYCFMRAKGALPVSSTDKLLDWLREMNKKPINFKNPTFLLEKIK